MALPTTRKTTSSIYDYPEHLNPFRDDDNHSKMRFWTIGRKKSRSNSFSFNSFKDFRNTWSLRSFRKKDAKEPPKSPLSCISAQNSPVEYRKTYNGSATLNRQSSTSHPQFDTLYTPLPRSRFHERTSHLENKVESPTEKLERVSLSSSPTSHRDSRPFALPGLLEMKADRGSYTSLQSNPFDDSANGSIRASTRKKRRAPLPPIPHTSTPLSTIPNITITDTSLTANNTSTSVRRKLLDDMETKKDDIDINDPFFNTELKIIEDKDDIEEEGDSIKNNDPKENNDPKGNNDSKVEEVTSSEKQCEEVDLNVVKEESEIEKFEKSIATEGELVLQITTTTVEVSKYKTNAGTIYAKSEEVTEVVPKVNGAVPTQDEESFDDVFKKVDLNTYKKQNSVEVHTEESNDKVDDNSNDISNEPQMIGCAILGEKVEAENRNDKVDDNSNNISNEPQMIRCAIFGEKVKAENRNDWEMTEFHEFDKVIRDIENSAITFIDEDETTKVKEEEPKQRRVSDMKLYYDNIGDRKSNVEIEPNSPNPIPKPRRTKTYSKSTSTDSAQTSPTTPTSL
ncbi:uncharacterized protein LOC143913468 [Arctopsyche grandis]|uniref:uncharacterized protein LOC143913468 n=1 Tax=Arctopsyche grandis TaxID=121162 RepID=UPI00406D8002